MWHLHDRVLSNVAITNRWRTQSCKPLKLLSRMVAKDFLTVKEPPSNHILYKFEHFFKLYQGNIIRDMVVLIGLVHTRNRDRKKSTSHTNSIKPELGWMVGDKNIAGIVHLLPRSMIM